MYALMASFSPLVYMYFLLIVMVAGFFVVNLFLAVIFLEFGNAQEQIKNDTALATQRTARGGENTERAAKVELIVISRREHSDISPRT